MNTRSTYQASRSGQVHSETGKARADSCLQYGPQSAATPPGVIVEYPIVESRCPLCSLNIGTVNLTIRKHVNDVHNRSDIVYVYAHYVERNTKQSTVYERISPRVNDATVVLLRRAR